MGTSEGREHLLFSIVRQQERRRIFNWLALAILVAVYLIGLIWVAQPTPVAAVLPPPQQASCLARAIYTAAPRGQWLEQAAIAKTVLNVAEDRKVHVCDAARGLNLLGDHPRFEPALLHQAEDVAQAVTSGDFIIAPAECAQAMAIRPAALLQETDGRYCHIGAHAFLLSPRPIDYRVAILPPEVL